MVCKKNRKKSWKKILRSQEGTTMVELIVAFVVVMIAIGLFTTSIGIAVRMYQNDLLLLDHAQRFEENYYRNRRDSQNVEKVNILVRFTDQKGETVLEVPVQMKKYESTKEGEDGVRCWLD